MRTIRRVAVGVAALFLAFAPATASAVEGVGPAAGEEGASAAAYEVDRVVKGTPPSSGVQCLSVTGAQACFENYGDKWWVKDTSSDGASAVVIWDNYRNGSLYRQGECQNRMGAGSWGVCNKNYYEGSNLQFRVCVADFSEGVLVRCSGVGSVTA
ncbi:hypothetical protein ACWGRK_08450 [Saccharomonospora azurea]|uniref:Secreted protein n=1 Tax=Saccharomonospora azurea NA-128 TaxID=882081 RepID=H8G602_9PSEU|nr:hypothetical protein [Saccharomonospora azurea]EHK88656.1 hypothetical protein SZMC14600_03911 [Saccharomonospora azurea SZMC 14600]EHY91279.1 hypothetical protein SacazDRAFT_04439 [Saccharomonospora azurea NA-128]